MNEITLKLWEARSRLYGQLRWQRSILFAAFLTVFQDSASTKKVVSELPVRSQSFFERLKIEIIPNFERLVLGCIDSYDSNQILIFSGFSRSTRFSYFCTAQISKIQRKTVQIFAGKFAFFSRYSMKICDFSAKFWWIFAGISQKLSGNGTGRSHESSSLVRSWGTLCAFVLYYVTDSLWVALYPRSCSFPSFQIAMEHSAGSQLLSYEDAAYQNAHVTTH